MHPQTPESNPSLVNELQEIDSSEDYEVDPEKEPIKEGTESDFPLPGK